MPKCLILSRVEALKEGKVHVLGDVYAADYASDVPIPAVTRRIGRNLQAGEGALVIGPRSVAANAR